jgi:hypothetical protein
MNALRAAALILCATTALAACGGDDGPSGPDDSKSLVILSGDNQSGQAGRALPSALSVEVRNSAGDSLPDITVTWDVPSSAASDWTLGETSTTTGADGRTANWFALGSAVGAYQVRASIEGSSVTFSATASSSPVEIVSGNGQVGLAGAALAQPLVVRVVDGGGAPISGVQVAFQVTEAPGTGTGIDPATATTAADGTAQTVLTLGDTNGVVKVSASTSTATRQFAACTYGGVAGPMTLQLNPGDDVVITGADVGCVQLPAQAMGDAYEVIVTPLPQTLSFNDMGLAVAGTVAGAPQIVSPGAVSVRAAYSAFGAEGQAERERRAVQYEWDRQLRELENTLRPQISASVVDRGAFGLMAAPPVVGDQMTFDFSCVDNTKPPFDNAPSNITAEVIAVSNKAVIFEDVLAAGSYTAQEYDEILANFDNVIFDADTLYFGAPEDVAGDIAPGQVVILYSSGVNNMTESYTLGYISGFFCPLDIIEDAGNNAKMFYLAVPDPNGEYAGGSLPKDVARLVTDNTVAHEFQHLINARTGTGAAQEVWINEGLSHLAEEIVGHAAAGLEPGAELVPGDIDGANFDKYYANNFLNLREYLLAPGDTAALLNSTDPLGNNTFRMRGASWSFVRYLLDRFGAPATEWQITRQLINAGSLDSRQAVFEVFGVPFNDLAADWSAMLVVEDRTDLVGAVRPELELASYQLRSFYTIYPLNPDDTSLGLDTSGTVTMDLFTATAEYFTLGADAATSGSGLRLQTGSGADLSTTAVVPHLVIVRTK